MGASAHAAKNRPLQRENSLRASLQQPLTERCLTVLREVYGETVTERLRAVVSFYVGGLISYVERALSENDIPTPEQSVRLFERCVPGCMEKYL
ncbi:MAG: hypothetical protein IKN81_10290 [Oscillospiraceae bacterium]|nr:hypothetical protein [Oscillospiraceae bacterium]